MRRYLIVANQTLLGDHLVAKVRACMLAGPCQFHVVVPATHTKDHLVWTEGHDHAVAEARLHEALAQFRSLGADVEGEVGDARVIDAVGDAIHRNPPFDEIILSTLPAGLSKWLHQDLPHRVARTYQVPTVVVTAGRKKSQAA